MNDVHLRAKLARQFDHQLNGFVFSRPRPGSEKRFV